MRALLLFALLAACSKTNPYYCPDNPDDNCLIDADVNAPQGCMTSTDCTNADKPICETTQKVCVPCTADAIGSCSGSTPVCSTTNTCTGCTMHDQCASSVCLPGGSCAMDTQVAYVSASGAGESCTKNVPCPLLKSAVAKNLPFVKIAADGAANDTSTVVIDGKAVTILAEPGAKLDRDGDGPILEVRSAGADVKLYDLLVTGASGVSGADGILITSNGGIPKLALTRTRVDSNQGSGISSSGGSLTISQSTVSRNQGGGISVMGTGATFDITNSYIFRNGDPDVGIYGGLNLGIATAGSNRFEFNTVVDNRASAGSTRSGGVICDIAGFSAPNNIIARNYVGGSTTVTNAQTLGVCAYPSSKTQNDIIGLSFASPDNAPYSYKLLAGSSAIDQATTASSINVDFDGDTRPQSAQKDIGADELKP